MPLGSKTSGAAGSARLVLAVIAAMMISPVGIAAASSLPPASLPPAPADADYRPPASPAKLRLGRALFFDKILSGNRNISCASCHHPILFTGDALSLPVGEGGSGLGPARDTGRRSEAIVERVPRNAPAVYNLGAVSMTRMFWDGRLEVDPSQPSGFRNPAGDLLPTTLDSVLAAQAMFPVTSVAEMAGQGHENPIGAAGEQSLFADVWQQIEARLRAIPVYVTLFQQAYPGEIAAPADITYAHAANAIAAFEEALGRADDSPFDRYRRGEADAMSAAAVRGLALFYGEAGCASCHSGPFLTDMQFHAIAMPQAGPGKGDGANGYEDFGRGRVTGDPADRYKFRTPPLHNVALTGPWGHDGAYATLEAVIVHHLDPVAALNGYDPDQLVLPRRPDLNAGDVAALEDPAVTAAIAAANELAPVGLSAGQVADLVDFLHALTDPSALNQALGVPARVPSGLPVFD